MRTSRWHLTLPNLRLPALRLVRLLVFALAIGGGCVYWPTPPSQPQVPRFSAMLPAPLAIQIEDLRPAIQRGEGSNPEWLYPNFDPEDQLMYFADGVGLGLYRFGAVPGFEIVSSEVRPEEVRYLLRIRLTQWYARWPVHLPRDAETAPVPGNCEIFYELYRNGQRVHQGRHRGTPPPFEAPLHIIHAGNIEKIISDSLVFQLDRSHHMLLDKFMFDLADRWPRFAR